MHNNRLPEDILFLCCGEHINVPIHKYWLPEVTRTYAEGILQYSLMHKDWKLPVIHSYVTGNLRLMVFRSRSGCAQPRRAQSSGEGFSPDSIALLLSAEKLERNYGNTC